MYADGDTIVALATPPGRGGIGVIRVSGARALVIAEAVTGLSLVPRQARFVAFRHLGEVLDQGIALLFPGPGSFTGEDVFEFHGHGGPVLLDALIEAVLSHGARLARPGEFSERAFLNDKIDLAQAEAIADLIDSGSRQASRNAMRTLRGEFSRRVHLLVDALTSLRVYVEASIDFPEEEIDFLADQRISDSIGDLLAQLQSLHAEAQQGRVLRDGLVVVIAGRPNAGKSSLLNRLAGQDRAIVTAIPGTTRDLLREHIQIDGLPLHIIDTAGLRDSPDEVESEGIRRALQEIESADCVLLVMDSIAADTDVIAEINAMFPSQATTLPPLTILLNKIDKSGLPPGRHPQQDQIVFGLSALTGSGLAELREHLKSLAGFQAGGGGFSARRRHLDALERATAHIRTGARQLQQHGAGELLAEDLRQAQQALGEITGTVSSDELLGRIFSSFCIGK